MRGRDARRAASALKQLTEFAPLRLANLGKGQPRASAYTHKHNVQNIYLEQVCSHSMLSSCFTRHTSRQRCAPLPAPGDLSTCLKQTVPSHRSTKHNRESNRGKESILSPRSTGPVSAHFPPASTDRGRSRGWPWATIPAPDGSRGKLQRYSGNAGSLSQKEKAPKPPKRFPFPLAKSLLNINLVAWKSLAGGKGERG